MTPCSRKILIDENIEQLVIDSKFLEESCIQLYFEKLCSTAERGLGGADDLHLSASHEDSVIVNKSDAEDDPVVSDGGRGVRDLKQCLDQVTARLLPPTEASSAWLEMVLVESSLRNRDRMGLVWPVISRHYVTSFGMDEDVCRRGLDESSASRGDDAEHHIMLVHSIDRRVLGLFKVATRMLSRRQLCAPIIQLLATVFGPHSYTNGEQSEDNSSRSPNTVRMSSRKDSFVGREGRVQQENSMQFAASVHDYILHEISGQVSSSARQLAFST